MSDNVNVSELVELVNQSGSENHGLDYRFNHSSGLHTLTVRSTPEITVKTKDTNRALNFINFYSAGRLAGAADAAERVVEAATEKPKAGFLSRILRRG